jgi:hypothetical protein
VEGWVKVSFSVVVAIGGFCWENNFYWEFIILSPLRGSLVGWLYFIILSPLWGSGAALEMFFKPRRGEIMIA